MTDIVLTTLNARYWHSSFGLRYLLANMGELTEQTTMLEFGIGDRVVDVLSPLLAQNPRIIGFGVYIWNVDPVTKLVADLKRVRPDITVVLGGPEVSYETAGQPIVDHADYVITGEAGSRIRGPLPPTAEFGQRVAATTGVHLTGGDHSSGDAPAR